MLLNNSIITGQDYSITYELSIKLDELIAEYYRIELDNKLKGAENLRIVFLDVLCFAVDFGGVAVGAYSRNARAALARGYEAS